MMRFCFVLAKALLVAYLLLLAHTVYQLMHPQPCRHDLALQKSEPGTKEWRRFQKLRYKHCLDPYWPDSSVNVDIALRLGAGRGDGQCHPVTPVSSPGTVVYMVFKHDSL